MAASSSWEGWQPEWAGAAGPTPAWHDDPADPQWGLMTPAEAGEELGGTLMQLKLEGTLSAKQMGILAFFCQ